MGKRERSKAYPYVTIQEAIELADRIRSSLGRGPFSREDIGESLGFAPQSGTGARKIAAPVHYGLLARKGSDYEVSDLGTRVITPRDEEERAESVKEAFVSVDLFRELVERYQTEGRIPDQLENRLVRDHGISQGAKAQAAQVFRLSAEYAGILNADGTFQTDREKVDKRSAHDIRQGTKEPVSSSVHRDTGLQSSGQHGVVQQARIALTGGQTMYMEVPGKLTKKDVAIIRKHVELLELQAEEDGSES